MTSNSSKTLMEAAFCALSAASPSDKTEAAFQADSLRLSGAALGDTARIKPPDAPARPDNPNLVPPGDVPRRRLGSPQGRAALLHAVAHIEFNAIDLAFDMALRFSDQISALGLDANAFATDWVRIGGEEARHFRLIEQRLRALECHYGALPAHNGLWEAAENTRHDVIARLAIAPLILEARGLDVTPEMMDRLKAVGDEESVSILQVIYDEEVGHVACGKYWFDRVCAARDLCPSDTFHQMRGEFFAGRLKPPFNYEARQKAGVPKEFYEPN